METGREIARLEDVFKEYRAGAIAVPALRGVTLSVRAGDFLSVAGPSGSGKTTLLNIVGCIDRPTLGEVYFDGREVSALPDALLADIRRASIGYLFQTFNLIPVLNALENVEFPLVLQGRMGPRERRRRAAEMLEEVGLADQLGRRPDELSGGQQQRVAVARALVKEPALVLADEPTANLDSTTGGKILELMREMNEQRGTTFLFCTHDRMVMDFARRLIALVDGSVASDASASSPVAGDEGEEVS